jgi:uncharacterized membrane protein
LEGDFMVTSTHLPGGYGAGQLIAITAATILVTAALTALSFGPAPATHPEPMSVPLIIHLATVLPALPLGAYLLIRRKGDALHRLLGRTWAGMMVVTAISSFWLRSNGSLSLIHIFSVMTLISIPMSIMAIRRGDIAGHRRAVVGVYIGLVVAGAFAFSPGRLLYSWLAG